MSSNLLQLRTSRNAASAKMMATVSGSFRQAMGAVQDAVYALTDLGVTVLSPADPRVVDQVGDFLFVASDYTRAVRTVQSRHLAAIAASDFLWLVAPNGYVGLSAAMEIGAAVAEGTPVYATHAPADLTLKQYVFVVEGPAQAIQDIRARRHAETVARTSRSQRLLLDPHQAIEDAHRDLDVLRDAVLHARHPRCEATPAACLVAP